MNIFYSNNAVLQRIIKILRTGKFASTLCRKLFSCCCAAASGWKI